MSTIFSSHSNIVYHEKMDDLFNETDFHEIITSIISWCTHLSLIPFDRSFLLLPFALKHGKSMS
jgi:hypothetical protein